MKTKAVSGMTLALVFIMLLTSFVRLDVLVTANPIPIPALSMPEEHIDAKISLVNGVVRARVNGTYPFTYIYIGDWVFDQVMMYYPVPPDADKTTVEMNETELDWMYSAETYPTILGNWPMIYWTISPVPEYFEIETYYEHPIPVIGGNYTFLYAMGTGKYLDYYAKETTAYVTVSISKDVAYTEGDINVYTIGCNATTEEWIWKPANYTITEEDETWIVTLTVLSEMFHPLEEDLLVTIQAEPTTWTVDDDGPADFHTIQEALNVASSGDTIYVYNGTYYGNHDVSKSVLLIGENPINTIIRGLTYRGTVSGTVKLSLVSISANNVVIANFTLTNSSCHLTGDQVVYGNGIDLETVNNCVIKNNIITNVSRIGINLFMESSNNAIYRNDIVNNYFGVCVDYSSKNKISANHIANNHYDGVFLLFSSNNSISGNTIANSDYGIELIESSNNKICHNNFINSTRQVALYGSYSNIWDDGYPSGGNYWSDYSDVDLFSGPDQNITGSDGIWDHPYVIDANNRDNYPSKNPWTQLMGDVNGDGTVDPSDMFDLSNAYGSVRGDANWDERCDFNWDDKVDALDLFDLSKNYGKTI